MMVINKHLFSFLLLISFFVGASAQATKQAAAVKPDAVEQNLRKHVAYLASDRLEGRRTGERGATWAAGYVANLFSSLKLKGGHSETANGKTKTSFLQPFPFTTGAVEQAKTGNEFSISVANSSAGQPFQADDQAAWKALAFSPNADVDETPVVFAGYGVVGPEAQRDDYAGLDAAGKIVLVLDGTPDSANPHSPLARFDARAKAKIARDKGARGLFVISRSARLEGDQLYGARYDASLGESAVPVILISRRAAAALLGTPEADLHRVESMTLARNEQQLADLRSRMQNTLQPRAAFQVNYTKKQAEAYNVIGVLEGTDPALKNEAVVVGAHYDHLGRGGQGSLAANSAEIHHGADDNASGVAALLELAREFAREKKNRRTIIFIAFGGEESGLIGSKHYVNNPVFPLDKTVAMINLDMVGRMNENRLTIGGVGTAGEWRALIAAHQPVRQGKMEVVPGDKTKPAAAAAPAQGGAKVPVVFGINGQPVMTKEQDTPLLSLQLNEDGFGPSDHSSFYGKQIPVLFFFTGTHADYHKPSDTAEKINYAGLRQIVSFVSDLTRAVDQNPARPTYKQAASTGAMGGNTRAGFNVSLGTIPSYAESSDGLALDGVRDQSPAAKAGIRAGDKIVRLAGKEIRNIADYTFVLGEMKPDVEYEIVVVRAGQRLTLKIIPAPRR